MASMRSVFGLCSSRTVGDALSKPDCRRINSAMPVSDEPVHGLPRLAELYSTAGRVGVQMVYVLDQRRHDGLGGATKITSE